MRLPWNFCGTSVGLLTHETSMELPSSHTRTSVGIPWHVRGTAAPSSSRADVCLPRCSSLLNAIVGSDTELKTVRVVDEVDTVFRNSLDDPAATLKATVKQSLFRKTISTSSTTRAIYNPVTLPTTASRRGEQRGRPTSVRDEEAATGTRGLVGLRQDGERAESRGGDSSKSACVVCSARGWGNPEGKCLRTGRIRTTGKDSTRTNRRRLQNARVSVHEHPALLDNIMR